MNCDALAQLYDVELSDLIHHDSDLTGETIAPKGKHIFGTVRVGERGQIVLPKQARDIFKIQAGDRLVVLGDESLEHPGIALMKEEFFLGIAQLFKTALNMADAPDEKEKEWWNRAKRPGALQALPWVCSWKCKLFPLPRAHHGTNR